MAVNKIVINDEVKIDLTADTVSPSTLASGITAHDKSGNIITGTALTGFVADDLKFSGDLALFNTGGRFDRIINKYFDSVKLGGWTENGIDYNVTDLFSAFNNSRLSAIPPIHIRGKVDVQQTFSGCINLTQLPTFIQYTSSAEIINWFHMFDNCASITNIPSAYLSSIMGYDSSRNSTSGLFQNCLSLKEMLDTGICLLSHDFSYMFENCCQLNKIVGLAMPRIEFTSNVFTNMFKNCVMMSKLTFSGSSNYQWKSQTIDFTTCGYDTTTNHTYSTSMGGKKFIFDSAKQVTDASTYNQLKDTADWWTADVAYSKYDRQSAIATIKSLPDTKNYLSSNGGTNTIKFKKNAGSAKGDNYNMSKLSASEIAVATAKGWTVSLVN